jgi:hypothetical protein
VACFFCITYYPMTVVSIIVLPVCQCQLMAVLSIIVSLPRVLV